MPPLMPYTTEKSPIFQVVESFANGDRARALPVLWSLLDDAPIAELPPVSSTTLNHGPYNTPEKRAQHVNEHWWGWKQNAAGGWDKQAPFDANSNRTTGFWEFWYGEAEPVFRETMIKALSISLGIRREDPNDTQKYKGGERPASMHGTRHWPISILWKCPSPWYEGWIEFQQWGQGPREGHVTVLLSTPAHGVQLYNTPLRPPSEQADPPYRAYQVDPAEPLGPNGLWLVSQVYHRKWNPPGNAPSAPGRWSAPTLGAYVESVGNVVTVATRVADGGVAPGGIPYTP